MIAVDVNVLVHASRSEMALHDEARRRLTALAEGAEPWALLDLVAAGYVRVVTRSIFSPPTPTPTAVTLIDRLLASPSVRWVSAGPRHWSILRDVLLQQQVRGGLVTDAVIVALCREHGIDTILSTDRDFARFDGITWEPLA